MLVVFLDLHIDHCDPTMSRPAPSPIYTLRGAGGALNTLHFSCQGGDTPLLFSGLVIYLSIHKCDISSSSNSEVCFYRFLLLFWVSLDIICLSEERNRSFWLILHDIHNPRHPWKESPHFSLHWYRWKECTDSQEHCNGINLIVHMPWYVIAIYIQLLPPQCNNRQGDVLLVSLQRTQHKLMNVYYCWVITSGTSWYVAWGGSRAVFNNTLFYMSNVKRHSLKLLCWFLQFRKGNHPHLEPEHQEGPENRGRTCW